MKKSINVLYKLYENEKEHVNIRVVYDVETDGKKEIYKCSVNLSDNKIPEWLTLTNFEIPTVHQSGHPGVSITSFSEIKGIKNLDTAFFIQQVYQTIQLKEGLHSSS